MRTKIPASIPNAMIFMRSGGSPGLEPYEVGQDGLLGQLGVSKKKAATRLSP
ncbi:MAG: hypothetical protein WBN95_06515 [Gammaproteobacteria bacterium]